MSGLPSTSLIRRVDLNDQVYDTLRRWLLGRRLRPGDKLSLHALASELGVSRSPVHHALTRLVAEGLITVKARRGYFVKPLTAAAIEHAYDVRLGLELVAAERSVGRLGGDELGELRRRMEAGLRAAEPGAVDPDAWHRSNHALHEYQVALAANPLLLTLWQRTAVNLLMQRVLGGRGGDWLEVVNAEHVELVAAFEAGDHPRVQRAIRTHLETGRRIAAEALEPGEGRA